MSTAIKDAGQELVHNRRNKGKGISWQDVSQLPDALRAASVTKDAIWPRPDYRALIASGIQPVSARLIKHVYDSIATKPTGLSDAGLQAYIDAVTRVRAAMLSWAQNTAQLQAVTQNTIESLRSKMQVDDADLRALGGESVNVLSLIPPSSDGSITIRSVFLHLLWPDEMAKPRLSRFRRGSDVLIDIAQLGGSRFFSRIQLSAKEFAEFSVEVREGWPAKRAAWQAQGMRIVSNPKIVAQPIGRSNPGWSVVAEINTNDHVFLGVHDDEHKARAAASEIKPHLVISKSGRLLEQCDSVSEAVAAAEAIAAAGKRGKLWEPEPIPVDKLARSGPARRGGDVASEELMRLGNLKGVNFGNWVPQGERQRLLNACFDSIADLAHAIGTRPSELGCAGTLGLAIGAQGSGKAGGHFIPGANEINATRFSGGGVISHEYGHFLDHTCATLLTDARGLRAYLSTMLNGKNPQVAAELRASNPSPQSRALIDAFEHVMKTLHYKTKPHAQAIAEADAIATRYRNNAMSWLKGFKLEQASDSPDVVAALQARAGALLEAGVSLDMPHRSLGRTRSIEGYVAEPLAALYDAMKDTGMAMPPLKSFAALEGNLLKVHAHSPGGSRYPVEGAAESTTLTNFVQQSQLMDSEKGGEPYWSLSCELFARAFASWVRARLARDGIVNEHLACDDHAHYQAAMEMGLVKANPFLAGDELDSAVAAIDLLVAVLPVNKLSPAPAAKPPTVEAHGQAPEPARQVSEQTQSELFEMHAPPPPVKRKRAT